MARGRVAVLALGVILLCTGCASLGMFDYAEAPSPSYVDESIFYAQLDPYGTWVNVAPFGPCWTPDDVTWGWRPYTDGYWAYTDYGWTWMSDEPWGWATYHYGRWLEDPQYGWIWVPGTEWAPAWVAWRYGGNWIGWAALPPQANWGSSGLSDYDDNSIPADQWCFVKSPKLLSVDLRTMLAPDVRNETLLQRTQDVTRFERLQGRPVNRGVELAAVEKATGRRPPQLKILDVHEPERGRSQVVEGTTVRMFRPTLRSAPVNGEARQTPRQKQRPAPTNDEPRSTPPPAPVTEEI